jgi:hypothetical protein
MHSDRWPAIKVRRFDNEPNDEYAPRRDEIVAIIDGFRHGRFSGEMANRLDERLKGLLSGMIDVKEPSPHRYEVPSPKLVSRTFSRTPDARNVRIVRSRAEA